MSETLFTANSNTQYKHKGSIPISLDNGLDVNLQHVIYWTSAPNLLSIGALSSKGIDVLFNGNEARIMKNGKTLYVAKEEGCHFLAYFTPKKRESVCFVSAKVWHNRLNHCGKEKLKLTVGDLVPEKEIDEFYQGLCEPCIMGKSHRKPIPKKTKAT